MSSSERRRDLRHRMSVAVRVQGFLPGGATWDEMTETDDVSAGGASLALKRAVELGQVLHLSLALPKRLRQYDLGDMTYRVYSLVRGIARQHDEARVGVMFFGKFPPRGFQERPWARFLLPSDSQTMAAARRSAATGATQPGTDPAPPPAADPAPPAPAGEPPRPATEPVAPPPDWETVSLPTWSLLTPPLGVPAVEAPSDPPERRAHPRYPKFMNLTLQQVDEWGAVLQEELTVADNVSRGGAHVFTTLDFSKGDVILLQEAGGGFATRAEVRAVLDGKDGIVRLHLRFLDRQPPDRLLKG